MHPLLQLPPDAGELARAWAALAFDPRVDAELRAVHEACAEEVRHRAPICIASGACCRFEEYGHRLYVTGLETAWTLRVLGHAPTHDEVARAAARGDCPFLRDGLCTAHAARPLGCRIYYCDPAARFWPQELSERLLARIRRLHEAREVPYRYGDWRTMLAYFV